MVLGILQFDLLIHAGPHASLKDKRRVVKSIKDRLHREHMVSVAEVAHHDTLNLARLALVCVCTDGRRAGEILDTITHKLRALAAAHGTELGDTDRQVIHASQFPSLAGHDPSESDATNPPSDKDHTADPTLADELLRHFESPTDPEDPSE